MLKRVARTCVASITPIVSTHVASISWRLILFAAVAVLYPATATATGLPIVYSQESMPGNELPPIEGFDHLFHEELDEASDLAPDTIIAPRMIRIQPYQVEPFGFSVGVNRGCGSIYYSGESIAVDAEIPTAGTLMIWSSTDRSWWQLLHGPVWTEPGYYVIVRGYLSPPVGNELIYARLQTADGRILDTVCHFYSRYYAPSAPQPSPPPDSAPVPIPQPIPQPLPPVPEPPRPEPPATYNQPLQCFVNMPNQVTPGVAFTQEIGIYNPNDTTVATGATLYSRISPAGYLPIYSCSPNCSVQTGQLTAMLGTINPGETRYLTIGAYGPQLMGQQFNMRFSIRSNQWGERTCATDSFTVGGYGVPMYIAPQYESNPEIEP